MTATEMHATRSNGAVEIDALAEQREDGRWHVRIAVIHTEAGEAHGVMEETPWYEDDLDELTEGDLATLADEALAAHVTDIRTVAREAAVQGAMARMAAHGISLARVSSHASACEVCQPWEGGES